MKRQELISEAISHDSGFDGQVTRDAACKVFGRTMEDGVEEETVVQSQVKRKSGALDEPLRSGDGGLGKKLASSIAVSSSKGGRLRAAALERWRSTFPVKTLIGGSRSTPQPMWKCIARWIDE